RIAGLAGALPLPPRYLPVVGTVAFVGMVLYSMPTHAYPAIPATVFLLLASQPLFEQDSAARRPWLIASGWVGVAGVFRWDFGLYGLVALLLATWVALWSRRAPLGEYVRRGFFMAPPARAVP